MQSLYLDTVLNHPSTNRQQCTFRLPVCFSLPIVFYNYGLFQGKSQKVNKTIRDEYTNVWKGQKCGDTSTVL